MASCILHNICIMEMDNVQYYLKRVGQVKHKHLHLWNNKKINIYSKKYQNFNIFSVLFLQTIARNLRQNQTILTNQNTLIGQYKHDLLMFWVNQHW